MKVSVKDLSREHIWRVADVKSIPQGWRREVWYNPEAEELYTVLLSRGESYEAPRGHVYLYTFVSLAEFWTNFPCSAEELGLDISSDGCPSDEDIENIYQESWWDEFEFPPELI